MFARKALKPCASEGFEYEQCKRSGGMAPPPFEVCEQQTKSFYDCFRGQMNVKPICLRSFNNARECLFKSDGSISNCQKWINYFEDCEESPSLWEKFEAMAVGQQKKTPDFDFDRFPGLINPNS